MAQPSLAVGSMAPDFELPATGERERIALRDFRGKKHVVLLFHPLAWSSVCSMEIPLFRKAQKQFEELNAVLLAVSVDSLFSRKAWSDSLGGISYPLLADFWPHGGVARMYGVFNDEKGSAERAIIVIDQEGKIQHSKIYPRSEVPDPEETLEVLRKLGGGKKGK